MVSELVSRFVVLTAGTLYPAYRSFKAVRNKNSREYVKWTMYWIVYAVYLTAEAVADILLSFWFPFYYHLKIILLFWLLSPWTKGASILYRKWLHPWLVRHERDIDALLEQAKQESYSQIVQLGSKGLVCARDIVAAAAVRGHEQLVQQLARSASLTNVAPSRDIYGDDEIEDLSLASDVPPHHRVPSPPVPRGGGITQSSTAAIAAGGGDDNDDDDNVLDHEYPATIPRRRSPRRL